MFLQLENLSKTKIKKLKKQGLLVGNELNESELIKAKTGLTLKEIRPKTINQNKIFKEYQAGRQVFVHGYPGTGKTFLALYLALNDVLNKKTGQKIIIVRSAVASRNIGFLPGNKQEKMAEYEAPYVSICSELFGRSDAYSNLKRNEVIEFIPTSFNRGLTWNDSIVIIDECQNMTFNELSSTITRLGQNSRVVICGDFRQTDFVWDDEKEGLHNFIKIVKDMDSFTFINMSAEDIVRSGLVKEYILAAAKNKLL